MPGPVEEGAKVASSVIDAMKTQPMTLALVVFNALFVILIFIGSRDFRTSQLKLMSMMIEQSGKSQEMLSKCLVPPSSRTDLPQLPLPLPYRLDLIGPQSAGR